MRIPQGFPVDSFRIVGLMCAPCSPKWSSAFPRNFLGKVGNIEGVLRVVDSGAAEKKPPARPSQNIAGWAATVNEGPAVRALSGSPGSQSFPLWNPCRGHEIARALSFRFRNPYIQQGPCYVLFGTIRDPYKIPKGIPVVTFVFLCF